MIRVEFNKTNQEYTGFKSIGHAGFGEHGTDIICAAVSALIINTINALDVLTDEAFDLEQNESDGYIEITFNHRISKESTLLLDALVLGITGIEKEYGTRYIRLAIKEV